MTVSEKIKEIENSAQAFLIRSVILEEERKQKGEPETTLSLYRQFPFLSDPGRFHALRETGFMDDDPAGLANLQGFLARHYSLIPFLEADQEISLICKSSELQLGEQKVHFTGSESWLMVQKDRDLRQAIEMERKKVLEKINPLLSHAHQNAHERCLKIGFDGMKQLWSVLRGIDFDELKESFSLFINETEDLFSDHIGWLAHRRADLNSRQLKRHDILYIFASNEYDRMFQHIDCQELLTKVMGDVGLPVEETSNFNINPLGPGMTGGFPTCIPIRIPRQINYHCPSGSGFNHYLNMLQECGRALYYSNIRPDLPFRLRCTGDPVLPQVYAFLFGSLSRDHLWLRRYLSIEKEPDLIRVAYLEKLYSVRAQIGRFFYELETESGAPFQDGALFRESMHHTTGVDYPPERHLTDMPPWFKSVTNLLAWNLEAGFRAHLIEEHGEHWFRNPETGEHLKTLWAEGFSDSVEEMALKSGTTLSDFSPLKNDFYQRLT